MQKEIKAAIIDLYECYPNDAIASFGHILNEFGKHNGLSISSQVFDLRSQNQIPDLGFDVYISSGGPGDPVSSEGSEWERKLWQLVDDIERHNVSDAANKKHVLFVCHSFQLMCRRYRLGDVNQRTRESYGIMQNAKTEAGKHEPLLKGLADNFYIFDSRLWQVVNPDMERFEETGATLLSIERERTDPTNPRALMTIRFSPYFFATQYHPEVDPVAMNRFMLTDANYKQHMVDEYGEDKYNEILNHLPDPGKLISTYNTIIPNFLAQAFGKL